jgi:hypothetical protein
MQATARHAVERSTATAARGIFASLPPGGPAMTLFMYLAGGVLILWLSSTLASFVNKKTDNGLLSAIAWFGSAYLLFELTLALAKRLY